MRILLDESLPRTLTRHFSGVTADQNLQYQQNLKDHEIGVVVLAAVTNRVVDLLPLLDEAITSARRLEPGEVLSHPLEKSVAP